MKGHPERARDFIDNSGKSAWHDNALWYVREKRDTAVHTLPEWEALREHAAQIKAHTISNIDNYLEEFEANCIENNITVHWAETDVDMREIVLKIVQSKKATKIVKSKSMLTVNLVHCLSTLAIELKYCRTLRLRINGPVFLFIRSEIKGQRDSGAGAALHVLPKIETMPLVETPLITMA